MASLLLVILLLVVIGFPIGKYLTPAVSLAHMYGRCLFKLVVRTFIWKVCRLYLSCVSETNRRRVPAVQGRRLLLRPLAAAACNRCLYCSRPLHIITRVFLKWTLYVFLVQLHSSACEIARESLQNEVPLMRYTAGSPKKRLCCSAPSFIPADHAHLNLAQHMLQIPHSKISGLGNLPNLDSTAARRLGPPPFGCSRTC